MDRHLNYYQNSAYNRTLDDFGDFVDNDSHISFESTENETFVDDFLDDVCSSYSEDIHGRRNLANRTINLPVYRTPTRCSIKACFNDPLTSTPKKQQLASTSSCVIRSPCKRRTIVRSRSFSTPSRREMIHAQQSDHPPICSAIHRSQSSLSLRSKYPKHLTLNQFRRRNRNRLDDYELGSYYASVVQSKIPFHSYHRSKGSQFLRRPYDSNNSSFSSTKPLMNKKNTAVISPINYTKNIEQEFSIDDSLKGISRAFTIAADRSPSRDEFWFEMKKPTIPKCTLRTSGFTLLVSGILSCLFSFHIIACKGKGLEVILSLISGFIIMCLGFTCLWIQQWQWFPNRNYVSGHILLSVFSVLQSACLWLVDQNQFLTSEIEDVMRGALYGLSSLTVIIASVGLSTSCFCKHPPPDNRVGHAVQGFTV